ncbi:MAG: hypothetical protein EHM49_03325 [Deltaproteobacteria bacterium]|nr:MAG: hypothetical protein EHM49_03325 [Deltaproteobacteria bacterium]
MRILTKEEKEAIYIALNCRNYIETGVVSIGAKDIKNMGEKNAAQMGAKINALSIDQMKLIILSDELIGKILQDRVYIED